MSVQLSNQPLMQSTTVIPTSPVLGASNLQSNLQQQQWQDPLLNKQAGFADDFAKRDALFHQVQLPQGLQNAQSIPATRAQLLPVGVQGFQQGGGLLPLGERTTTTTLDTVQTVQSPALAAGFAQSGTIALKPICIEQESVAFRPSPITIEQPPLLVQPEAITIPQPPIVIHPEPIVIPQAPLVFQPPAVSLARQAVTYQPDAISMARPSYTIQPIIQYDMRGCANFGQADFKQHVHIKLTNEQLMRQGLSGGQWQGGSQQWVGSPHLGHSHLSTSNLAGSGMATAPSSPVVGERAKFFSRDRDYNYGNAPSAGDKIKDALGVKNFGPQQPVLETSYPPAGSFPVSNAGLAPATMAAPGVVAGERASTFSRDRDYNYGNAPSTSDKIKDTLGVKNFGPTQPVLETSYPGVNSSMVAPTYASNTMAPAYGNTMAPSYAGERANTFSRDRDYNYGNVPSATDRLKDSLGVRNFGAEKPVVVNEPMIAPAV